MRYKEAEKKILELLAAVDNTDIAEVQYSSEDMRLSFKRDFTEISKSDEVISPAEEKPSKKTKAAKTEIIGVFSHSVGKFHDSAPTSRKAAVKVGQKVRKGEKLGVVESMRIMKDIVSPATGKVVGKYLKNNDPVQYGQKILDIEKSV